MQKHYPNLLSWYYAHIGQFFLKIIQPRLVKVSAILLVFVLALSTSQAQQPGSIDATFNSTDSGFGQGDGFNSEIFATAMQPDGKIIVGGSFTAYNSTT